MGYPVDIYYALDRKSSSVLDNEVVGAQPARNRKSCRRFARRFSYTLVAISLSIWLGLTYLRNICMPFKPFNAVDDSDVPTSLPDDVFVQDCASWFYSESPDHEYVAHTSLQLPISSPHLFFASQGSILSGTFHLVPSDHVSQYLDVHVSTISKHPTVIDFMKVCSLGREGGGLGIGLLAPLSAKQKGYDKVDIVVRIPKLPDGEEVHIESFETNLPFINHEVDDLSDVVTFGKLRLGGAFSGVNVKSIAAVQAIVKVTHAPIIGTFNASDSLSLATSSGPVSVVVNLFNDPETGKNTSLDIWTGIGPIDGTVNLYLRGNEGSDEPLEAQPHGLFNVSAYTSLSPLHLTFPHIAPSSVLALSSYTGMGPHRVEVHEEYEGKFSVSTGIFDEIDVRVRTGDIEDPQGKGRIRRVEFGKVVMGTAKGEVWWDGNENLKEGLDNSDGGDDGDGGGDVEPVPVGSIEMKSAHGRAVLLL